MDTLVHGPSLNGEMLNRRGAIPSRPSAMYPDQGKNTLQRLN